MHTPCSSRCSGFSWKNWVIQSLGSRPPAPSWGGGVVEAQGTLTWSPKESMRTPTPLVPSRVGGRTGGSTHEQVPLSPTRPWAKERAKAHQHQLPARSTDLLFRLGQRLGFGRWRRGSGGSPSQSGRCEGFLLCLTEGNSPSWKSVRSGGISLSTKERRERSGG